MVLRLISWSTVHFHVVTIQVSYSTLLEIESYGDSQNEPPYCYRYSYKTTKLWLAARQVKTVDAVCGLNSYASRFSKCLCCDDAVFSINDASIHPNFFSLKSGIMSPCCKLPSSSGLGSFFWRILFWSFLDFLFGLAIGTEEWAFPGFSWWLRKEWASVHGDFCFGV